MVYFKTTHKKLDIESFGKDAKCPDCGSKRLMIQRGKLSCTNCGAEIGSINKGNKYGAKRTEMNGQIYDSKFEASVAAELEVMKRAGEIKDYDTQFKIEGWVYRADGEKAFPYKHKVDFRIHKNDGSYELREAKGKETEDYLWRRKILEHVWLPEHLDHEYVVVYQGKQARRTKAKK